MTDDKVKEAVERLTLCAKWCDTKDMTIKGQKERAAFAADIRAMLTRNDALQAERDKLSAEVAALKQIVGGPLSYTAMRAAKDAAEAKLTALVEEVEGVMVIAEDRFNREAAVDPLAEVQVCILKNFVDATRAAVRQALAHHSAPVGEAEGGQDRKFAFRNGQFVNRVSGEPIPKDEPIIIFRARDRHALSVLEHYLGLAQDSHHQQAIRERIAEFQAYRDANPERLKEPGITRDITLSTPPTTPTTPTSAPVEDVGGLERDTTKLDATALTDAELIVEQTRVEKLWDSMFEPDENGEVFEGHGGSPGEWMQERMIEIAQEQQRRGDLSPSLIQPETIPAADDNHKALVEACKPFSALADYFDGAHQPMPDSVHLNHGMTLGDCRRVRQAMAAFTKETDHGGE